MSQRKLLYVAPLILITLFLADCASAHIYTTSSVEIGPVCWHKDMPWSEYECPGLDRLEMFAVANVETATLTVRLRDGRTLTKTLSPTTDAVFLSKAAVENFLLRHYDATDEAKARDLRARLARDWR